MSTLGASSDRGRLLRLALAQRGVARLILDEGHCISQMSAASYSPDLAAYGALVDTLLAQLGMHGHPRPQLVIFSSSSPPALEASTLASARVAAGARVARCSIDRPEVVLVRIPFPLTSAADEPSAPWSSRGRVAL